MSSYASDSEASMISPTRGMDSRSPLFGGGESTATDSTLSEYSPNESKHQSHTSKSPKSGSSSRRSRSASSPTPSLHSLFADASDTTHNHQRRHSSSSSKSPFSSPNKNLESRRRSPSPLPKSPEPLESLSSVDTPTHTLSTIQRRAKLTRVSVVIIIFVLGLWLIKFYRDSKRAEWLQARRNGKMVTKTQQLLLSENLTRLCWFVSVGSIALIGYLMYKESEQE